MKRKKIKMVVTDLDDTLLTPEKEISPEAISVIDKLKEQNIHFTFITGRPAYAIKRFAEKVEITAPIVSCNGAIIYDSETGQSLKGSSLPIAAVKSLLNIAVKKELTVLVFAGEIEYALSETSWTKVRETAGRKIPITSLDKIEESGIPIYKANIMADGKSEVFVSLVNQINDLREYYSIALYGNNGCEIVAKNTNKKNGLIQLCKLCDVPIEEVLAIGDNANDHEMLRAAGIGAVVANGTPEAKKHADYVCKQPYTEGVVEAIKKFADRREE